MARKKSRKARKKDWVDAITQDCKNLGVYKTAFDPAINMLADVMLQREDTWDEFESSGGKSMLPYTNKGGSENFVKNPKSRLPLVLKWIMTLLLPNFLI